MDNQELRLKPGGHRVLAGCPWIFRGELLQHEAEDGAIVQVVDTNGRFVGRGLYNGRSLIQVRIMARARTVQVTDQLVAERVRTALAWRQRLYPARDGLRLINSEADGLPGLVIDKMGPMIVMEVTALGMAQFIPTVMDELVEALQPTGIYERGDLGVREREGLPRENHLRYGELVSPVEIHEHGISYRIDVAGGQKTGHFLDQYENRWAASQYMAGGRVADVFCHTGGFGLLAAKEGAADVIGIDSDLAAIGLAQQNVEENGLADRVRLEQHNAFDWLRQESQASPDYDAVILDPPAFTKSRSAVPGALRGYREINLRALKMLKSGGVLVTSSCSYHVSLDQFIDVVGQSAHDAHRAARVLEVRGQSKDHPVHPSLPESRYLKCLIVTVD